MVEACGAADANIYIYIYIYIESVSRKPVTSEALVSDPDIGLTIIQYDHGAYICEYAYTHVYTYVYIDIYVYVYMCECVNVHICTYIHVYQRTHITYHPQHPTHYRTQGTPLRSLAPNTCLRDLNTFGYRYNCNTVTIKSRVASQFTPRSVRFMWAVEIHVWWCQHISRICSERVLRCIIRVDAE